MTEVLKVRDLVKEFAVKENMFRVKKLKAVNGISFTLNKGQGLALVGESGCGKSTAARCILKLIQPTSGEIYLRGEDITAMKAKDLLKVRGKVQMVFQDPYDSLNPRMNVKQMLDEVLKLHTSLSKSERYEESRRLMEKVWLETEQLSRYPHEFSGGQQQRLGIARAMASGADIFVLDEPTSALDTSIKGQILELLVKLREEQGYSYLFITHNISVIQYLCCQTAVMYLGRIVELGKTEDIITHPLHPYTKALMSAIPIPDPLVRRKREVLKGETPSPIDLLKGCALQSRCAYVAEDCRVTEPRLRDMGSGHMAACLRIEEMH